MSQKISRDTWNNMEDDDGKLNLLFDGVLSILECLEGNGRVGIITRFKRVEMVVGILIAAVGTFGSVCVMRMAWKFIDKLFI